VRLEVGIIGDIVEQMREEIEAGEKAVTAAMSSAAAGLKTDWRLQVLGAGLGPRMARTIQSRRYPQRQNSLNASAMVWTNAPDAISAFDSGAVIKSKDGLFLAIPTEAAGTRGVGGKRITPAGWEQRTGLRLKFVYRRRGPSFLVAEARVSAKGLAVKSRSKTGRGVATVPIFLLVAQVSLRKRLDLARDADAWVSRVQGLIVSNWD
jgi:hypothetical protein